jgi:hypothetical protein
VLILFWGIVLLLASTASGEELVIQDQTAETKARLTESPTGSINIYDAQSNRLGYWILRSDGSVDFFRPDGSRLGYTQPSRPESGQPSRLILTPNRR